MNHQPVAGTSEPQETRLLDFGQYTQIDVKADDGRLGRKRNVKIMALLFNVHNFVDRDRIRMMVMEWVDGYDLSRLMVNDMLHRVRDRVSARRWEYLNRVIVTKGKNQPRLKAGIAVAVVRDCLSALAALHRRIPQ